MFFAIALGVVMGVVMGLLGGGGSILTVPILVYVVQFSPKDSIALSLGIVGLTSLVGTIRHYQLGNTRVKVILPFAAGAMAGSYLGAQLSVFFSGRFQLMLFAVVMLAAALLMFFQVRPTPKESVDKPRTVFLVLMGLSVGVLTGLVGVGGGFLIVPALVLLAGLPMSIAVGCSLPIIALNALSGFVGYWGKVVIPEVFFISFSSASIVGVLAGSQFVSHIPQRQLKKIFSVFLVIMGSYILFRG